MDARLANVIKIAKSLDKGKKEQTDDTASNKHVPIKDTIHAVRDTVVGTRLKIIPGHKSEEKKAEWRKAAQAGLDKVAIDLKDLAHKGEDRLGEYWQSLSPATKQTLLNTLIGSAIGGTGGAVAGGMTAEPGHGLAQALSKGTTGALLGGAAAGAGTAGLEALLGGRALPDETKGKAVSDRMSQAVIGTAMKNPFLTLGTGIGGASTLNEISNQMVRPTDKHGKSLPTTLDKLLTLEGKATSARDIGDLTMQAGKSGLKLMGLPAGMVLGYLVDKYIRGDYD